MIPRFDSTQGPTGRATMSAAIHTASNYHRWTFDWIAPYLGERILDIGGGTGNHLEYLAPQSLVSVDIDDDVISELRERYRERSSWRFERIDITAVEAGALLGENSFDTVLSCNVFEHIKDDWMAFKNAGKLLAPGGNLVLVLPASSALYGSMDQMAGHYRRYDPEMVSWRLAIAGLEAVTVRYVNPVGALGWFINNRVLSHGDLSSPGINGQIRIFDRLLPAIRGLDALGLPFGQSLLVVAQKPMRGSDERNPAIPRTRSRATSEAV